MTSKAKNYWEVIRALGSWAVVAFLFGLLFKPVLQNLFPVELRDDVIVLALPFVAYFAAILLLFILGVNLISPRLHRSILTVFNAGVYLVESCYATQCQR